MAAAVFSNPPAVRAFFSSATKERAFPSDPPFAAAFFVFLFETILRTDSRNTAQNPSFGKMVRPTRCRVPDYLPGERVDVDSWRAVDPAAL